MVDHLRRVETLIEEVLAFLEATSISGDGSDLVWLGI